MIFYGIYGGEIESRKKQLEPFTIRVTSKEDRETEPHPVKTAPLHFGINQHKLKSIIFYCHLSMTK